MVGLIAPSDRPSRTEGIASGVGTTLWQVVVGRIVSGIGGGGMMAMVLVLIAGE